MPALTSKQRTLLGVVIAVTCAAVFGLYPAATRGSYAGGANAVFLILFTTFFRALTLSLFCASTGRGLFLSKPDTIAAAKNGFFQMLSIVGILGGMVFLPGPVVITVMFSYTILLYILSVYRGDEKAEAVTLSSVLAALFGVALVVGVVGTDHDLSLPGLSLAFMAAVATATRMYSFGALTKSRDPAIVGAETFVFTFGFSLLVVLYDVPRAPDTGDGWLWAALAAASLSIGGFGMFYGIALLGAFRFAFLLKLEPVFGAILSFWLIAEPLAPLQYAGIVIVVLSLMAYQRLKSP